MDLSKVFAWRFWHLLRDGGRFGVVLPRQAILSSPGMAPWRRLVLSEGSFEEACLLTNNRKWIFDDVHPQYTIVLTTVRRGGEEHLVRLDGPHRSREDYMAGRGDAACLPAAEFAEWSEDLFFPAFRSPGDVPIYRKMLAHPRFGDTRADWKFRAVQGDVNASSDRELFTFAENEPDGYWPVYSGASFNLWTPETGQTYAWVDPDEVVNHLFEKRRRQARQTRSAYSSLSTETIADPNTLACLSPRIAFRDIARATDSRTMIAALIPPHTIIQHTAPGLVRVEGDEVDEAYLLGVFSSRIFDWITRR